MSTPFPGRIRRIAIGIFRRSDSIFVALGQDPATGEHFCRPPGGEIEFGEGGAAALRREMLGELGAEITTPRQIGTIENRFTYDARRRHEFVLLYEAAFVDAALYEMERVAGR